MWTASKMTWISWRTSLAVFITLLQIQALVSVKTTAVIGIEGQRFDFICEYPRGWEKNSKYFYHGDDKEPFSHLIQTDLRNEWKRKGRLSIYDNTTGAFFIVKMDQLSSTDSGTYWCGVDVSPLPDLIIAIELSVSQGNETTASTKDHTVHKLTLQLILITGACVAAVVFVCLFTCYLLLAVKHRSGPRQKRETSSDYETMMPGVKTEPEFCCTCSAPDCPDLSALPRPPSDLRPNFTSKYRESAISFGFGEYVDVDVTGMSQYQHLDLSQLDENIYHSLTESFNPKHGPVI
ncbi:uncharacterized protein LOC142379375 [Odontesthes bonariensis]|uniref:uncharacterized protein LOC142379375 n=1 Tax=Odontesthes bonariensis TaxID=219752 RepID=UPI003F589BF9